MTAPKTLTERDALTMLELADWFERTVNPQTGNHECTVCLDGYMPVFVGRGPTALDAFWDAFVMIVDWERDDDDETSHYLCTF